jgi:hypothetical protein
MIVKVEDLDIGDELLVGYQGGFRRLKILEKPRIGKRVHWQSKDPLYVNVKVSTYVDTTYRTSWRWANGNRVTVQVPMKEYKVKESDEHNTIIKVDLNYKDMWLLKKNYNN